MADQLSNPSKLNNIDKLKAQIAPRYKNVVHMALDVRKPVRCLRTLKAQTSLRIHTERIISKLATREISIFDLVSVAEQGGLSMTWSEILKTGF